MAVCRTLQDMANMTVTLSALKDAMVKHVSLKVEDIWVFFNIIFISFST